jgi:hypothetical protein
VRCDPNVTAIEEEKAKGMKNSNGGQGTERGADAGEAGGRGAQTAYTCINCGAVNYVDPNWSWFTCWKCNLQKPLPLPGH